MAGMERARGKGGSGTEAERGGAAGERRRGGAEVELMRGRAEAGLRQLWGSLWPLKKLWMWTR